MSDRIAGRADTNRAAIDQCQGRGVRSRFLLPSMNISAVVVTQRTAYLLVAVMAVVSAACLEMFGTMNIQPVLGSLPLLPVTIAAALVGLPISTLLERRGLSPGEPVRITAEAVAVVMVLGGLLALPPIAIDIAIGFPRDMNMPLPDGLFFYPGIAIVAEAVFHLIPLAILALLVPKRWPVPWLILPVVFVEPVFQLMFVSGSALMSALVFGNVALVSAAQLWLFRRYGFVAMICLRLAFYLVWHILWGTARLSVLS